MRPSIEELVSMVTFARVVEAGSFTAAAELLNVSKSVVSKRVAKLEEQLETRLLHRTTRKLSLTPEGARLYERCLQILRAADEAAELAEGKGGEPRGVLRVNCPATFSDRHLVRIVSEFVQHYPHVEVDLSVINSMVDLISERVDVAIRITAVLRGSNLVARRVATTQKRLCASPAYLQTRGVPASPEDLRAHDCLRFSLLPAEIEWRFYQRGKPIVVPVKGSVVSDNSEALRQAALVGVGLVILPLYYVAADLAKGQLVSVLDDFPLDELGIFVMYSKGKFVPPKVRAFVDFLASRLRRLGEETGSRGQAASRPPFLLK